MNKHLTFHRACQTKLAQVFHLTFSSIILCIARIIPSNGTAKVVRFAAHRAGPMARYSTNSTYAATPSDKPSQLPQLPRMPLRASSHTTLALIVNTPSVIAQHSAATTLPFEKKGPHNALVACECQHLPMPTPSSADWYSCRASVWSTHNPTGTACTTFWMTAIHALC